MATETLLINRDDIMKSTGLGGNVDNDYIYPHIKTAQDIHLQTIIGTQLYDKLTTIVGDDTWEDSENTNYALLLTKYITPVLVYYTMVDFLPFDLYRTQNGGTYRHTSDNAIVAEPSEMINLVQIYKDKAEFYQRRMHDYLCANTTLFPEYTKTDTGEMPADSSGNIYHGWTI